MGFLLGMLLSVTANPPTRQQIRDACLKLFLSGSLDANNLREELRKELALDDVQDLNFSMIKATKAVNRFRRRQTQGENQRDNQLQAQKAQREADAVANQTGSQQTAANKAETARLNRD